jgi:bifunctional UDP-N-acetylglucosamine pyrophosphorylase/glucosamine-1-phosphate N-acetyltransferase/UDP-N-acetylglucosamine pyrophosphorylase
MDASVAIVLAAGKGTRMQSALPKVLHPVCGRPMIEFVLDALLQVPIAKIIVVVGYRSDLVRETLAPYRDLHFVEQTEQLGTGHAVMVCRDELGPHAGPVLVVTGDSPLIQVDSVRKLLDAYSRQRPAAVLGTLLVDQPTGLGRIVRDEQNQFQAIVEERDATPEQKAIREVNMSTYVFAGHELLHALGMLRTDNRQREYYLTDCPGILRREGKQVLALPVLSPCEGLSINTLAELEVVEAELRRQGF